MIKKAYLQPAVTVVKIQLTTIIAASIGSVSGADGLGKGDDWESGTGNARKGGSLWDDED